MLEWFRYNESDERLMMKPYEVIRNLTLKEERIYQLLLIDGFIGYFSQPIGEYCAKYDILVLLLLLYLTYWMYIAFRYRGIPTFKTKILVNFGRIRLRRRIKL